jgi:hypothetical protein
LRTKVRKRKKEHTLDISVCFSMVWEGRSEGVCRRVAFRTPVWVGKLRQLNGTSIAWTDFHQILSNCRVKVERKRSHNWWEKERRGCSSHGCNVQPMYVLARRKTSERSRSAGGVGPRKEMGQFGPFGLCFFFFFIFYFYWDWACLLFELGRMPVRCYGRINLDFDMQIKKIMF